MPMSTDIVTVIVAVVASGGLWGFVQFLINRRDTTAEKIDKTNEKIDKLTDAVKEVSERVDMTSATNARTRILRFDDELINGIHHSREYFQQTLEEIDIYETYCEKHPRYKNNACLIAIEHIRRVYNKLLDEGGFIQ